MVVSAWWDVLQSPLCLPRGVSIFGGLWHVRQTAIFVFDGLVVQGQSSPVDLLPSRRPAFSPFFFRPDWVGLFGSEDLMTRFPGSLDPFLTPMTVVRGWCGCPGIAGDPIRASAVGCAHHTFFGRGLGALHHGRRSSGNIRHRLKSPPI